MNWIIIESIAVFMESVLISRFIIQYFHYRNARNIPYKSILLFSMIFVVDMLGTFFIKNELTFMVGVISSMVIFSLLFLSGSIFEKILLSVISYSLVYLVNLPVLHIIGLLSGTSATELIAAQDSSRIACLLCTKFLYFAATQCILWFRKKDSYHFKINEWIIVISALLITLLIWISMYIVTLSNLITNFIFLFVTLLLASLNAIIFLFIQKMSHSNQKETEKELLQFQLQQEQKEMRNLEHQYQEISILRHDFQNKVQCIYTMLEQNNYEDARRYTEKFLKAEHKAAKPRIRSSNSVLNAIMNEKIEKAEQYQIEISCRVTIRIPEYLEYDLSILLANLLDNAIEACQNNTIPSQIIVVITETAGYFRIAVKNTIQESVLETNQKLESRKKDKAHHGFGLKSVRKIVEKYQGSMEAYEKKNVFIISILLLKIDLPNMGD